jgi:hypothetical protein
MTALRGDAISSLAYVANLHFALGHQSYFDQFGRPADRGGAGAGDVTVKAAAYRNALSGDTTDKTLHHGKRCLMTASRCGSSPSATR